MPRAQAVASRLMCSQRSSIGRPARTLETALRRPSSVTTIAYPIGIAATRTADARPLPPAYWATPMRPPTMTPIPMTGLIAIRVVMEDLLDRPAAEPPDRDRERHGGQVAARLDRVHPLPRHMEAGRKLALAEASCL